MQFKRISNDNNQNVIAVEEHWLLMDTEYHFLFQSKNVLEFDWRLLNDTKTTAKNFKLYVKELVS